MSGQGEDGGKQLVRRFIEEVMNGKHLELIEELYSPALAKGARAWITPFVTSFPDAHMQIVTLVAEGDTVVGRFRCSGTHLGEWAGEPPTGRRFRDVDEVYFFTLADGRIAGAWGLEDTQARMAQLGLTG